MYFTISKVPSSPQSLILCFSLNTLSCKFLPTSHVPYPRYESLPTIWDPFPTDHSLHPARAKHSQRGCYPSLPLLFKLEHYSVPSFPLLPVFPQELGMPCRHHFSSCRICLCRSSCIGLNSTFLCILWLQENWCLSGLCSLIACGLIKATTSVLCTAQQAHQQILQCCSGPLSPFCSHLCFSVSALKTATVFHEQRKHLDSDKVMFSKLPSF